MDITEVRIKLMDESGERLQAFCSITFDDCFVIRDLKIIEGANGPFVAMPSRKLTTHCPQCGCKNHIRAAYCNQCGVRQKEQITIKDEDGRIKLYADIAHPINSACREMIQNRVVAAFEEEKARSLLPGYVPSRYDDFDVDMDEAATRSDRAKTPERPSVVNRPHFQRATEGAQGPHRVPVRQSQTQTHGQRKNSFGAGLFD